ncbi:MAG: hypothetical protein ACRDT6_15640 [Micromonosporaceae bacterium]
MGYEWLPYALMALRGVEPYEVIQALHAVRRWPVPAIASGTRLLTIWSRTREGRPMIVMLRHQGGMDWLIIGARDMNSDELAGFERWEETDHE